MLCHVELSPWTDDQEALLTNADRQAPDASAPAPMTVKLTDPDLSLSKCHVGTLNRARSDWARARK